MKKTLPLLVAMLLATVGLYAQHQFDPGSVDFGQKPITSTTNIEVVITSQINQQVTLSGLSAPFTANPASFAILIGEQKSITITFNPQEIGAYNQTLTATGGIWGTSEVQVSGQSVGATISYSPPWIEFDAITMTHHADSIIFIQSDIAQQIELSYLEPPFSCNPLIISLIPEQPTPVIISFDPTAPGNFQGALHLTGSISGFTVFGISGNATEAHLSAFPQICNFSPQYSGETSTIEIVVTTDINQNITLSGLAGMFDVSPANLTMAADEPQTIFVSFSPQNPGLFSQTLQLTGSLWGIVNILVSGECIDPQISVSPNFLDFGDVALLSTATREITISNTGNGMLECVLTNGNAHFGISMPTVSVPENESQLITVTFTPDLIPTENDTIFITTNDPNNPLVKIPLSGQGVSQVSGEVCGTWYKDKSPYNFAGTVTVPKTCTLIIEPGVVVNMFDYDFSINGKLVCNGLVNDSIRINGTGTFQLSSTCPSDSIDYVAIDGGSVGSDGMSILCFGAKINNSKILASQIKNGNDLFYDDFEDGTWDDKWMIVANNSGSLAVDASYGVIGKGLLLNTYGYVGSVFQIQTKPITAIKYGYFKILLNYRVVGNYGSTLFFWRVNNGDWNQFYSATYTNGSWLQLNYPISYLFQQNDLVEILVSNHRNYLGYFSSHQIHLDEVKIATTYVLSLIINNSSLNLSAIDNYAKSTDSNPSLKISNSTIKLVENIESHPDQSSIEMNNAIISQAGSNTIQTSGINSPIALNHVTVENASGNAVRTNGKFSGVTLNHVTIENATGNAILTNADTSGVALQNCLIQNCGGTGISVVGAYSPVIVDSSLISNCLRGMQIANSFSPVTITNSTISYNTNDGVYISGTNSTLTVDNSEIINNNGNGISCYGSANNGQLNVVTSSNISGNKGSGIYGGHSLNISNSTINQNGGSGISGQIEFITNSNVNQNGYNGIEGSQVTIANCFVNSNNNDGISASHVSIIYSIVSSNKANGINSIIFYGNHITSIYNDDKGLVGNGLLLNSIVCSNTQYGSQYSGGLQFFYSKVIGDPKLADSLGHLLPTSPCIDAADPDEEDANIPFGMGTIRSDMGAYGGPENWVWGGNPAPTDGAAKIVNIVDLPQDQGKMVGIQFNASLFDIGNPAYNVSRYSFWRELDENGKQNIVASKTPVGQYFQKGAEYWEYMGEMPAMGFQNYGYSAPTLGDSTENGIFWSKFLVVAHTLNTSVYWVSLPDSGYSVDNLAPAAPLNLAGSVAGVSYNLQWTLSPEQDLQYYAVYRSTDGNFETEPFATTTEPAFPNIILNTNEYKYAVAAFDHSGNKSGFSNVITSPIYDAFTVPQGWSGISSWILPNQPAIENVLAPLSDDLIILYNQTGVYWPGQNVNTLGDWGSHSGYVIKLSSERVLPMVGIKEQNTIFSTNTGWQILPVLSPCTVPTSGLQVQPASSVVMIKEIAGWRVYWPDMGVATLDELLPGKAYYALTGNNGTIEFPTCGDLKESNLTDFQNLTDLEFSSFGITTTPVTHIIAIPASVTGNLEIGDAIAVFSSSGVCAGVINIQDKTQTSALTVFGDDPTTSEKEGMAEDETLHFKVYKTGAGAFADAEVSFDPAFPNTRETFATNGVSAIALLKVGALATSEMEIENIQVFPNPGNGKFTVSGISEGSRLEVTDVKGQIIWTGISQTETMINLTGRPDGLYFLKISKDEKVRFVKLVIE